MHTVGDVPNLFETGTHARLRGRLPGSVEGESGLYSHMHSTCDGMFASASQPVPQSSVYPRGCTLVLAQVSWCDVLVCMH